MKNKETLLNQLKKVKVLTKPLRNAAKEPESEPDFANAIVRLAQQGDTACLQLLADVFSAEKKPDSDCADTQQKKS